MLYLKPDDAADALALAICHAHSNKMNNMLGMNGVKGKTIDVVKKMN